MTIFHIFCHFSFKSCNFETILAAFGHLFWVSFSHLGGGACFSTSASLPSPVIPIPANVAPAQCTGKLSSLLYKVRPSPQGWGLLAGAGSRCTAWRGREGVHRAGARQPRRGDAAAAGGAGHPRPAARHRGRQALRPAGGRGPRAVSSPPPGSPPSPSPLAALPASDTGNPPSLVMGWQWHGRVLMCHPMVGKASFGSGNGWW